MAGYVFPPLARRASAAAGAAPVIHCVPAPTFAVAEVENAFGQEDADIFPAVYYALALGVSSACQGVSTGVAGEVMVCTLLVLTVRLNVLLAGCARCRG